MAPVTNEGDIAFNKLNVALARSQRQIASWLPQRTAEETSHTKSEAEIDKEDAELFQPISELAGLGAAPPKEVNDGDASRQELSSNEKLRRQLFGGKIASRMKAGVRPEVNLNGVARHRPVTKPARCGTANRGSGGEEEEEEGGRSSLGRSKRKRKEEHGAELNEGGADTTAEPSTPWSHQAKAEEPISKSKPAKNFLDEILAEKSRKKKKKRKRKHEKGKED